MLGYPRLSSVRPQLSPSYPGLSSVILGYPGFTLNYPWHLLPQLGSPWLPSVVLGYPCARDLSPPPRPTPPRLSVLSNLIAILVRFLQTTLSSPGLSPVILGSPPVIPELSWVILGYPRFALNYPRVYSVILGTSIGPQLGSPWFTLSYPWLPSVVLGYPCARAVAAAATANAAANVPWLAVLSNTEIFRFLQTT